MKGFAPKATFYGYTVAKATSNNRDGVMVTDFVVGVGGWRDKGIPGFFVKCHAWGVKAKIVTKAIKDQGLAVVVTGRITQKARVVGDIPYIDNDLQIWSLSAQASAGSLSLSEIVFPKEKMRRRRAEVV